MKNLVNATKALMSDLASTAAFLLVITITNKVGVSVLAAIALGVAQISWQLACRRKIDLMQGMSQFLVIITGVATILAHDPRFVMLKPSLIYAGVGIVMLRPGWMVRYLPDDAVALVTDVATMFGQVWAGLMFVSAGVNLYAGLHMSPAAWAGFMSAYGVITKLILFTISYFALRTIGRRRHRNDAAGQHGTSGATIPGAVTR